MYEFERKAISKKIDLDGILIHYLEWPGVDPAIVLLHPNRTNSRVWDFMVDYSKLPNRFLAWDARGHGLSDYPESGYDLTNFVSDLNIFCNKLNLKNIIIIGAATGGNIALLYASKFESNVSSVIVADPGLSLNKSISKNVQNEIEHSFIFENFNKAKGSMPFSALWSEDMINHYAFYSFRVLENLKVEWRYFPKGAKYTESLLENDMWDEIHITCDTLIIRGSNSDVFPKENMIKLSGIIPKSKTVEITDCNHRISQDQPFKMAQLIDLFLSK